MSYGATRTVEARGLAILSPFLTERAHEGRLVLFNKGALAKALQFEYGDLVFNSDADTVWVVELKTEEEWTGNLFLETWSNRNLNDRASHAERGSNVGWMFKQRADLLLCYFLDTDDLIVVPFFKLKRWAFGCRLTNGEYRDGRIYAFDERDQGKRKQMNDTRGRLVPVDVLENEVAGVKRLKVRQLALRFPMDVAA